MIAKTLEKELNLEQWQVNKVIKLIDALLFDDGSY